MLQEIIWIIEKELRYALRDTDVLIYSLLVPLLIYPAVLLAASEVVLWQISEAQQNCRVFVGDYEKLPVQLQKAVAGVQGIKMTGSDNAMRDLDAGKLDAVVSGQDKGPNYQFTTYVAGKKGMLAANKISEALVAAQNLSQQRTYKTYKIPRKLLVVCQIQELRLVPFKGKIEVEKELPVVPLAAMMLGILQIGLTAGVTSVCVFAEEKEKRTYETTMSLPVQSYVLAGGKWLASSLLALLSGLANIFSIGATAVVVFLQAQSQAVQKVTLQTLLRVVGPSFDPWTICMSIITLLVAAGLSTAVCLLFVSACKTFKDGQAIVTYPMLFIIMAPVLAFIPGIELNPALTWLPFANLLICVKHPQGNLLTLVLALFESILLMLLCVYFAGKIFFSEKSMFTTAESRSSQRPHEQASSI